MRHHLFEGMRLVALRHTEMARELATPRAAESSTVASVLRCSPSNNFHVGLVGELAAKFQNMEEQWSQIEQPTVRICDPLLRPPPS
jgi:hypothetical protein